MMFALAGSQPLDMATRAVAGVAVEMRQVTGKRNTVYVLVAAILFV